ncbi:MAG TPA: ROK family protein [Opitutaceae bacterium]|nr:ROK family protein [Opitutaceae bacterium]
MPVTDEATVLGLDLGGSQVKGLAFTADGRVVGEEIGATNDQGDHAWRENVRRVANALTQRHPRVRRIGLCAPGLAARDERTIVSMPGRLRGLEGFVWADFLGLPAVVLNDAHAALLGEGWQGAARGRENVLMVTLGTGVGGAALVDGRLLRGHLGRAGHVGHISLNPDGAPDIVQTPGSLEDAIGECTLAKRSGGRFATTAALLTAVRNGDAAAAETWQRSLRALSAALAGLINVLDPEIIVIGGGIASAGEVLFAPLRATLSAMEWRVGPSGVQLVAAQLGPRAGAYGAAFHALQTSTPA